MRLGEKEILASLTLMLVAFSAVAQTRIFEGPANVNGGTWVAEIGLYLPFVLFALVSTYHFLDWARKHRRQAILLGIIIVSLASILGVATAGAPRPLVDTTSLPARPFAITQGQIYGLSGVLIQQPPSFQDNLQQLQTVLNSTPYYTAGANALVLLASVAALVFVLLKMRNEGKTLATLKPRPILTQKTITDSARDAVVQSYRLAYTALQTTGLNIPESDTPQDICTRARLAQLPIADTMSDLTTLFEEAKFSVHPITQKEAEEAKAYWDAIRSKVSAT
jgi:hypothetical protein